MPFRHLGVTGQPGCGVRVGQQRVHLLDGAFLVARDRPDSAEPTPESVHRGQLVGIAVTPAGRAVVVEVPVQGSLR